MKQRQFRIKEHLLKGQRPEASVVGVRVVELNKPMPDVVWVRYNLVLGAMSKRFNDTQDMFDYVQDLEDFIYSAISPADGPDFTV